MALEQPELFSTTSQGSHGNFEPKEMVVAEFATNAGAEAARTLAVGTAVSHDGTNWIVLDGDAGDATATIMGIVYPDVIVLSTSDEVLGQVMVSGRADYNSLVLEHDDTGVGYNQTELDATLKADAMDRGLFIKNLADVR